MDWNKDRSVRLTAVFVFLFAAALLAADVLGFIWIPWFISVTAIDKTHLPALTATVYTGSVFAWICLCAMFRLLRSIRDGDVFTEQNARLLRVISWCCAGACIVFLVSVLYYPPFIIISTAAGFMMMIVRVVKNIIQQATGMKSELDLTV